MDEELRKLIVDELGVDIDKVTREANIIDDLGADSLDIVDLVMEVEELYDIEISDDDAKQLSTVGDIADYVERVTA